MPEKRVSGSLIVRLVALTPKLLISRFIGVLVQLRLPRVLAQPIVQAFRSFFKIDLTEAIVPPNGFPSIGELFTRELKVGARPMPSEEGEFVYPVDGKLREYGPGTNRTWSVKGLDCSIEGLLGGNPLASRLSSAEVFHLYLSPPDYHHVHAPIGGNIVESQYVPGTLWPVNDWALSNVQGLFCVNERLITYIESEFGLVAVVMVGALNVGRITVQFDSWVTNTGRIPTELQRHYDPPRAIVRGERLGTFHMGSSVVLIIERRPGNRADWQCALGPCRWGQQLFSVPPN